MTTNPADIVTPDIDRYRTALWESARKRQAERAGTDTLPPTQMPVRLDVIRLLDDLRRMAVKAS